MGIERGQTSSQPGELERTGCPDFEMLSAYFDGELVGPDAAEVRNHVRSCELCAETLRDFGLIRNAILSTTPPVSDRLLTIYEAASQPAAQAPIPLRPRRSSPLYPIVTAVAAVLVLALIATNFFVVSDEPAPAPTVSGAVLVIDGTPFSAEDNDAEFGAASAGVMEDDAVGSDPVKAPSGVDEPALSNWTIALLLAVGLLAVAGGLWARDRKLLR